LEGAKHVTLPDWEICSFAPYREIRGKNLILLEDLTAGALRSDGSITQNGAWSNYRTTGYLPINGETHVVSVVTKTTGEGYNARLVTLLYDAEHNPIKGSFINAAASSRVIDNSDAAYLRVSVNQDVISERYNVGTQVEKGDEPSAWEGYGEAYAAIKVDAENITPHVITENEAEEKITEIVEETVAEIVEETVTEKVAPIVKSELVGNLFDEPRNLFHDAELHVGFVYSEGNFIENSYYNVFKVPALKVGKYGIYPQCRYVVNGAKGNHHISWDNVEGEFIFAQEEESPVFVSFYARNTENMLLYRADLYTYDEVERYYQGVLDTEKVVLPSNILHGKKWAVCGDSFSDSFSAPSEADVIPDGKYAGKHKIYGYLIGNRNEMEILHMAQGGQTLADPAFPGDFVNSFTNVRGGATYNYQMIDADVDYVTLYFGINDSHHESGSSGTDGEDVTGKIPLGEIDDTDNTTFCGAWNVCLEWLITNRPFAHIGIIVSNGCDRDEYRTATIAAANKWGIPYIDLNGDERTPMMLRSTNPAHSSVAKNARRQAQAIDPDGGNWHPNAKAHEYQSTFIEAWLRTL
jgi:hypothetical protein